MRIHDPSFIHLQSVGLMMPGHLIADTMAIMASLDPIMGGVDKSTDRRARQDHMTVVGKSWNRLTLPGKVIFTVVPLLIVVTVVAVAAIAHPRADRSSTSWPPTCRSCGSWWRSRSSC